MYKIGDKNRDTSMSSELVWEKYHFEEKNIFLTICRQSPRLQDYRLHVRNLNNSLFLDRYVHL